MGENKYAGSIRKGCLLSQPTATLQADPGLGKMSERSLELQNTGLHQLTSAPVV